MNKFNFLGNDLRKSKRQIEVHLLQEELLGGGGASENYFRASKSRFSEALELTVS